MRYSKYSGRGNFFSLPNEVFQLGLNAGELSVYSFLRRCENHGTHQCWSSIRTIGQAVRMNENIRGICRPITDLRRTKGKAGESPGAFVAPGRSLPPAVRAVSGNGDRRFSGRLGLRLALIF